MSELRMRTKYFGLPSQQRRLRHLRSIAARNVLVDNTAASIQVADMDIFFTLHQHKATKAFYTSEKIKGSMNPTWRSFNLDHMCLDGVNTASTSFAMKVWRGIDKQYKLCMEWEVDLTGLVYSGDKLLGQSVQYPSNVVIFGMFEGFYVAPEDVQRAGSPSSIRSAASSASLSSELMVEDAIARTSYSVQTLLRIQTVLRAIKQTQASVSRVRTAIEEKLQRSQERQKKKSSQELLILRINLCRTDLEWRTNRLQHEKEEYEAKQAGNYQKDVSLKTRFDSLHKDKVRLHEKKKSYFDVREELIKNGAQLVMRRKQLISELAFIYPIQELPNHVFSIAGVRLPNSEDFAGENEMMLEVGLGYTCHLVQMISHFLDVPSRYPMEHRCSRSQIRDHIMEKLTDKDRDFPLFTKGKERFQFNYGVYLINKNIAQLRYYCGLGTTDLRLTLPNLKSLLELRLGVKYESTTGPLNALTHQHLSVPPNLGGPQRLTSPSFSQSATRPHNQHNTLMKPPGPPNVDNSKLGPSDDINGSKSEENGQKEVGDETDGKSGRTRRDLKGKELEEAVICGSYGSPRTTTTLDQMSKEKLLGSVAIFDDLEVSSSEDSSNATYGSKFKMWTKVEQHANDEIKNLIEGKGKDNAEKRSDRGGIISSAIDENSTFKTRAMFKGAKDSEEAEDESGRKINCKSSTADTLVTGNHDQEAVFGNVVSSSPQEDTAAVVCDTSNTSTLNTRLGSLDNSEATFDVHNCLKESFSSSSEVTTTKAWTSENSLSGDVEN